MCDDDAVHDARACVLLGAYERACDEHVGVLEGVECPGEKARRLENAGRGRSLLSRSV